MSLFVSNSNTILNIGEKATDLLNSLVDQFDDSIIEDVLDFIQGGQPSERLSSVNRGERNELRDFFGLLLKKTGGDEAVQMLRKTVDEIPNTGFAWVWKDEPSQAIPLSGSMTLTLGATASAEAKILPQPSYHFKGQAGVSGSVTVPFSYGAFTVRGGAKGSAELVAIFNHPDTPRVITALANDLPIIVNLVNPQQLPNSSFGSATLKLQGEVNLGAEFTAGKSWVASLGRNGRSTATAEVTAGLKYSIDWARTGEFEIAIQPNEHLLDVTLTEVHKNSKRRSLSIGANVKFSGLREAVLQPVMDQIIGLPEPIEKIVQEYSRPSDVVKKLLTEQLGSVEGRLQELAQILIGDNSAESFVHDLIEEALEVIDGRAGHWTALVKGEIPALTSSILNRLSIPQTAKDDLEALLNEKLLEVSGSLSQNLKDRLQTAVGEGAGSVITDFLNDLSLQSTNVLNVLNVSAAELFEPVTEFLERYRKFEQSIVDAVEVVEKEEFALQFSRTVDTNRRSTTLLKFRLNPSDTDAKGLYRQMLVGNFRDAITAGLDGQQSYITLVSGQFKDVFERKATSGIKINLFGRSLASQRTLSSTLTVENTVGGEINVFDATGSAKAESLSLFGKEEKEETIISSSLSLVRAQGLPNAQGLSIRLRYSDENLTVQEMRDFLTSFSQVGLLAEGAADRVSDGMTTLGSPDDDGDRALKISAQMSLTRAEIEAMATINKNSIMTTAIHEQLDALDETPVNQQYLMGILPSDTQLDPKEHELFTNSPSRIIDELIRRRGPGRPIRRSQLYYSARLINGIGLNAQGLVEFLKLWQELIAMTLPQPGPNHRIPDSELSKFDTKNTEMIESLENWALVAGTLRRELGEEFVSPWALAFFKTLRTLSGRGKEMLPIYISWNQDGRIRRIAVI